ncbi:MAG: methyl-accepting chemotaxis protein [Bryobacteraceae bacterium]
MRIYANLQTRTKLMLAFGLMALLMGVAGWQGAKGMARMNANFEELYHKHALGLAKLKEARTQLLTSVFEVRSGLQTRDLAAMARHAEAAVKARELFDSEFTGFRNTVAGDSEGAEEVQKIFAGLSEDEDRLLGLAAAGKTAGQAELVQSMHAHAAQFGERAHALEQRKLAVMQSTAERVERVARDARAALIAVQGASMMLAILFGYLIAGSISRPLKRAVTVLEAVAEGDFTRRLGVHSRDEMGQLSHALDRAVAGMRRALGEVGQSATDLNQAAYQLASASDQLASGAHEQATSLEQTASSLEEITATVKQNADNAEQASRLASGARDQANAGGAVVASAVAAMGEIDTASRRIADIITAIDEIAFQTNLLALNAAVEAARAGEQGRGFAVVAAEVRNLAQRSAAAAKEIKGLIQDSVDKVSRGCDLVNRSGQMLEEIVGSVKRVTDIVGGIAAASREQAVGVEMVSRAVVQMDNVTQANSAQTSELATTAQSLSASARRLQEMVGRFRLDEDRPAPAPRDHSMARDLSTTRDLSR